MSRRATRAPSILIAAFAVLLLMLTSSPVAAGSQPLTLPQLELASASPEAASPEESVPGQAEQTGAETDAGRSHDNNIRFERISLDEGLSQSVVPSMLQDAEGFMWFGTQDGLNRYDGYDFVVYKHDAADPDSLGDSYVWAIHEDRAGALWIGTNGAGLDRFDRNTGRFFHYRHDPDDPHSLGSNTVLALYEDRDGALWIGTGGGGLNKLETGGDDSQNARFTRYLHDPSDPYSLSDNTVQAIFQDREDILWIGTDDGGLNRLVPEAGDGHAVGGLPVRFVHFQNDPVDPHSLSSNDVQAIYQDSEGVLWIGTSDGGLNRFDGETEDGQTARFTHFRNDPNDPQSLSHDDVPVIYEDRQGMLWIGTNGGGLDRLVRDTPVRFVHHQNKPSDAHSLSNNQVWSIHEDEAGVLWVGTFGGGLSKFDRNKQKFVHHQADPKNANSLSNSVVWSFLEDPGGVLWIGTNGGGLNRYDRLEGEFVHYRHVPTDTHSLSDDTVWSIHRDREGVLWLGTSSGLDQFDPEAQQFINYPAPPIFTIHESQDGMLWFGTWGAGLARLDREADQLTFFQNDPADPYSLSDDSVITIHEGPDGGLWVGTFNGGLDRLDWETGQFLHHQNDPDDPQSLSHNTILSLHLDPEGVFWIGTGGGGLNRFDPTTGTFVHYTENDGLPNNYVYGILAEDPPPNSGQPRLWLSTNRGLSRFDPQTEDFRNYDEGDGLQSNEFNQGAYYKSPSGEMFFGGVNGFNTFFPEQVKDNPYIPPVVLTALTQGGEPVDLGMAVDGLSEVTFRWPRNFFEFEYAALSYADPKRNEYAYILEGFDPERIETGTRRFGRYTNLPGGTYTLRISGSNNDGVWNEEGLALHVTVVPPFWQTWWFLGGTALMLIVGAFVGYRLRLRNIERHSRELEAQVAERTKQFRLMNDVGHTITSILDLDALLQQLTRLIQETLGYSRVSIGLLEGDHLIFKAAVGPGWDTIDEHSRLKAGGDSVTGWVASTGQPLLVPDVRLEPRFVPTAVSPPSRSELAVPLKTKEAVIGVLNIESEHLNAFEESDVTVLESLASQAAVAIENARLYEQAQQLAVVEERHRLARDLHDSVTQSLYGMALYSEAASGHLSLGNLDRVEEHLGELHATAQEALTEMRLLIYELRPPVLQEEGIAAALQARLQSVEERAGLQTDLQVKLADGLPTRVEDGLYRIAQEALNNALKHAQAHSIAVRLVQADQKVTLDIRDDGIGFDPATARNQGGVGLSVMQERAAELGARLTIDSEPGAGTRVFVEVHA